jgi:hypothetical protein
MPITFGIDFWNGLLTVLQNFMTWLTDTADGGAMIILQAIIGLIRGIGFVTSTDIGLVNTLTNLIGMNQVIPLADAILQTGLLLGAVAYAGHHYFGWRGIGDSIQRLFIALLATRLSIQIMDWSLQVWSGFTSGLAANIPDFPNINGLNPLLLVLLMAVWVILLFQLVLVCAERIAWLVILKPLAPIAFVLWAIPQTAWIPSKYLGLWVGWLIGQLFVVLAVAAMELMVNRGGIEGYFLSCGCLVVARHAISIFVPAATGGSFLKLGPVKV